MAVKYSVVVPCFNEEETVGDIEASHILITVDVKDDATDEEKDKADKKALKKAIIQGG